MHARILQVVVTILLTAVVCYVAGLYHQERAEQVQP